EVVREVLLPGLGERLAGENVTAADVRRELDAAVPPDLVEEKVQLCMHLPQAGVAAAPAEECLRVLQADRLVPCPECHAAVPMKHQEIHLRRAHHIFQFRGVRRPLEETFAALFAAVCGPSPDYDAWKTLEEIARDEH